MSAEPRTVAIKVGGEWHNVQDDDGALIVEVDTSEQCDACGANLFLQVDMHYECASCGNRPAQAQKPESEVVF